ncbi:MAG TPA: YcaO-like family protein, partial [Coleofasciculaceae cyanobacterium]
VISGARDDIFHQYYETLKVKQNHSYEARNLASNPPTIDASNRKSLATGTFEEDIEIILKKLTQIGLDQVIVFDLSPPEWGISVVRVIVPELEASFNRNYKPKSRAIAFAERQQTTGVESNARNIRAAETHLPAGGVF